MPFLRSLKIGSAELNSQKVSATIRIIGVIVTTTETDDLLKEVKYILSPENAALEEGWKGVGRALLARIKSNEEVLLYLDEDPKRYLDLRENALGLNFISEELTKLATDRTTSFSDCMAISVHTRRELEEYVLTRAYGLAATSEHYLVLAEKYPGFDKKEKQEHMLKMASRLAQSTEGYVKTIKGIASHGFPYDAGHKKDIGLLIERCILSMDATFDAIDKIFGIFGDWRKEFCCDPPEKYVEFFERTAIESAIRSDISFVFKKKLSGIYQEGKFEEAKKLMSCIITLEGMRKDCQNLPENSHTRKFIEAICQNNQ